MIPQIIHHIWLGKPPIPELEFLMNTWKETHPHWEYRRWTEESLKEEFPEIPEVVFSYSYAFCSDIFRLAILNKFGGVYSDSDFESVKCLDQILESPTAFVGQPSSHVGHVSNAIMGSIPNHPFITMLLDDIERKGYKYGIYGPHFLTQKIKLVDSVKMFPKTVFYPYYAGGRLPSKYPAVTHAVHHWAASWLSRPDLHTKFINNVKEVMRRHGDS